MDVNTSHTINAITITSPTTPEGQGATMVDLQPVTPRGTHTSDADDEASDASFCWFPDQQETADQTPEKAKLTCETASGATSMSSAAADTLGPFTKRSCPSAIPSTSRTIRRSRRIALRSLINQTEQLTLRSSRKVKSKTATRPKRHNKQRQFPNHETRKPLLPLTGPAAEEPLTTDSLVVERNSNYITGASPGHTVVTEALEDLIQCKSGALPPVAAKKKRRNSTIDSGNEGDDEASNEGCIEFETRAAKRREVSMPTSLLTARTGVIPRLSSSRTTSTSCRPGRGR